MWYETMEKFEDSGMTQKEFCNKYKIDYKAFCNLRYRMIYKRDTNPELYAKLYSIGRKYMKSGDLPSKFAKDHEIGIRLLSEISTHIGYLDLIAEIKAEKEASPMKFVQIQHQEPLQHAEVMEKQNDIEIIITKGVKVSISPNIDSMKIIKIIELLKDL